jgi:predicted 2-oxoglutarate/Fe(II)-dependent dioxygenase YbiX
MIPQNLMDYVKIYENHVDPKICKDIVKNLQNIEWQKHEYYDSLGKEYISYDHELSISQARIPESDLLNKQVWFALEKYVLKDFASFSEWFGGWSGYSHVRFNKYDPTTQMKLHCDHISTLFEGERRGIPTLTVLGALNDDYEGGELMMFQDMEIKLPPGAVIVFPSNFLYPHEVKPVKSGVRYSYVSWSW